MKQQLTISRWSWGFLLRNLPLGLCPLPWLLASAALAQPVLRCEVTYAGATQSVEARPVTDPYPVRSVDIGERFRFKPVLVRAADGTLDRAVVQVYVHTPEQPVTIQVATWPLPRPSAAADGPAALSGWQHLYAGPLERELIYGCALREQAP